MVKKWQYGPIAQLGERTVRIRKVVGSIPIRSTISRKITANLAVIFRLTTILPQTGRISDHFLRGRGGKHVMPTASECLSLIIA